MITIVILISIVISYTLAFNTDYHTHKNMVKKNTEVYGYGTFDDFLREFNKFKNWERDSNFPKSYFGKGDDYYRYKIHANIIMFDGEGMILKRRSYHKFNRFINKYNTEETLGFVEDLWKTVD